MSTIPKMGFIPNMRGMGGYYCGRRGLPKEAIATMYADYLRLGSLEKAGEMHGRTRQSMFDIFKRRGLKLREKKFLPVVVHKGKKYTAQKTQGRHRYLRCTIGRDGTLYLHHVIWIEANGPIPAGHKLAFKDGDHLNCSLENLELLTNSQQVSKYAMKGRNQFTVVAGLKLGLLLGSFQSERKTIATKLK